MVVAGLVPWREDVSVSLALSLQLLGVVTVAAVAGLWPGLVAAITAPLLVNWFLVPPYESLHIGDRQNEVTLVVFLAVAGAVSAFVSISAARAAAAERRQLAAETDALARSDALRASLLRAVSHDLRTPLASIKASVSSLREPDIEWSETDRADFLETIENDTDRLTGIITDLLDLSKLQAGAVQPDLTDASAGRSGRRRARQHRRRRRGPHRPPRGSGRRPHRSRYSWSGSSPIWSPMPSHGRHPLQHVRIGADRAGDRIELFIIDHGPGIDPDQRTLVRRPFQRVDDAAAGGRRPRAGDRRSDVLRRRAPISELGTPPAAD